MFFTDGRFANEQRRWPKKRPVYSRKKLRIFLFVSRGDAEARRKEKGSTKIFSLRLGAKNK
jgi:hypothetical protein